MKFVMLLFALLMFCPLWALAQNTPKAELFGGYSYTRWRFFQEELDKINGNGWHVALSAPVPVVRGLEGEVEGSGHYGSALGVNSSLHTFLAGPRFAYHGKRVSFFSHFLIGRARVSADAAVPSVTTAARTDAVFAQAAGGGFDLRGNDRFSLRVVQVDFITNNFSGYSLGVFRFSTGVVLRFGKR